MAEHLATTRIGPHELDHVSYDAEGDVLYLRSGDPRPAADTFGTPEGHAVRLDENGKVIGITVVNAKWLIEREGKLRITIPYLVETSADEVVVALSAGE